MPTTENCRIDSADRKEIVILANQVAGSGSSRGRRIDQLVSRLRHEKFAVSLDRDRQTFLNRVRKLQSSGELRCVVAAGGDGTAEFVANSVTADVPIMVFPLGTENLLAKFLHLSADADSAARTIIEGRTIALDAGCFADRVFLIMLSCGFDAEVVHRLHAVRTGNITRLAYLKPIVDSIRTYQYPPLRVTCWNSTTCREPITCVANWVFVFNIPLYALGLDICPEADAHDGFLDVATFEGASLFQGLQHLSNVWRRRHTRSPGFRWFRAKCVRVELESEGPRVPVQVDGEPCGHLPVDVHILERRLTMLTPSS
jgi:diacylglycerol kinase family enzyme